MGRRVTAVIVLLLWASSAHAGLLEKLFAPKARLWEHWSAQDPESRTRISHDSWTRFLTRHLAVGTDGVNRLDYGRVSDSDAKALEEYVERLAATPISRFSRAEQLAYWINLYNALTVKVVLEHYPVASIRDIDISPGLFADGPWKKKLVEIEGKAVSLDDIEHRILRPIWKEPRIHYALNCASIGCPNLQPIAFSGENAESMMQKAAHEYVNHPRGVRFEPFGAVASSIYSWFEPDFDADGGVLAHLIRHADPRLRTRLAALERIDRFEYDWSLNDEGRKGRQSP
jgi:hypothetical protein